MLTNKEKNIKEENYKISKFIRKILKKTKSQK